VSPIHLHLDHAHILVEDIPDYAPAYACMAEAIHTDQPLTVVVRHPTCAAWLRAAQQKHGPERIQVTTVTPRRRLAELWSIELPAWVTDEAIARSGLLELPLQARPASASRTSSWRPSTALSWPTTACL
jgi:hypothetical protein